MLELEPEVSGLRGVFYPFDLLSVVYLDDRFGCFSLGPYLFQREGVTWFRVATNTQGGSFATFIGWGSIEVPVLRVRSTEAEIHVVCAGGAVLRMVPATPAILETLSGREVLSLSGLREEFPDPMDLLAFLRTRVGFDEAYVEETNENLELLVLQPGP